MGAGCVGTEDLLLGLLFADGSTAQSLISPGLSVDIVETALTGEIARIQKARQSG